MAPLNRHMRLRAASLLEALVASVLFLAVFCISLETLSRLAVTDNGPPVQAALDNAVSGYERRCLEQRQAPGVTRVGYPWGELFLSVTPYKDESTLQQIVITAKAHRSRKRIERRRILYHPQNPQDDEE